MLSPEYTRIAEGAASAIAARLSSATTMICAVTTVSAALAES
jgi:hypothetical protein